MRNILEYPVTAAEADVTLREAIAHIQDRDRLICGNLDALLLMKVREYININQKDFDEWIKTTVKICA
jgi:hypothetical protein